MIDYTKIKCSAIRHKENSDLIISGYRHADCFLNLANFNKFSGLAIFHGNFEQGFIDLDNKFYTREEAAIMAFKHGQITKEVKKLYSEDLY